MQVIIDNTIIESISELVARGVREQFRDRGFRVELADCIGKGNFNTTALVSKIGEFIVRHDLGDMGRKTARQYYREIRNAPALIIFSSDTNDPKAWIKTGELYQRVALTLTDLGIQHSFYNQAIELPHLKKELQNLLGINQYPQLIIRAGYAKNQKRHGKIRKSVEDVLMFDSRRFFSKCHYKTQYWACFPTSR